MIPRTVLVTRPEREAVQWVSALQAHGVNAHALPLIHITPVTSALLDQARSIWQQNYQAVMFVSVNAVVHFFSARGIVQSCPNTRLWAPGPGTVAALRQRGLPVHAIDSPAGQAAQFDSEALWHTVAAQICPGMRVLIVRGSDAPAKPQGHGRQWLTQRLMQAGAKVDCVAAYQRHAPQFTPAQCVQASQAASDGSLWLFSSALAVNHLQAILPQQVWHWARALATHPRISQAAHAAGFGCIHTCRPTLEEVLAEIV